jgi:hypothetical protein
MAPVVGAIGRCEGEAPVCPLDRQCSCQILDGRVVGAIANKEYEKLLGREEIE